MDAHVARRRTCRAPVFLFVVLLVLLLPTGAALAADGVPLYPPGVDAGYAWTSMENPDMSATALTFELIGLDATPPYAKSQTARVMFWNAATGVNRPIGAEVPALPDAADQRSPAVCTFKGDVYTVWQQWNDPVTATRDIWLWRGAPNGDTDAGFPMLLVSGPAGSNQYSPEIGVSKTPAGDHLVVAWADDRDTAGATTWIYMLDLSANTDGDANPNYLEPGYDPAYGGDRVDPTGDPLKGQFGPAVGAKGVFWFDLRGASDADNADIYRADLNAVAPIVSLFWTNPADYGTGFLRATGDGAAWLGPGIAGGPFEPWVRKVGGGSGITTIVSSPMSLDASGSRLAVTGGHGGNTSGDPDVYFYDPATRQNVPVCSVGADIWNKLKIQDTPALSTADGGYRVVWADSRKFTNTAATDSTALAYELYVALVPTVSLRASRTTVKLGGSVTLTSKVTPRFGGSKLKFQKGTAHSWSHAWLLGGKQVWYTGWKTLKGKSLSGASTTSWTWTPGAKGTYWVRAWFSGGTKYADVGSRKVPHVANTSKVIKVIVK
jgi:hypothetical protein